MLVRAKIRCMGARVSYTFCHLVYICECVCKRPCVCACVGNGIQTDGAANCAPAAVCRRLFNCTWSRKSSAPVKVTQLYPLPGPAAPLSQKQMLLVPFPVALWCCGWLIIHCKYTQLIILFRVWRQAPTAWWLKYLAR